MSLLDRIDSILPRWMLEVPRQQVGKLMGAFLGTMDALALQVIEARLAGLPGQVRVPGIEGQGGFDSNDALPLIGRDRSIRQGLSELPWDYAARLRAWMDSWQLAGTPLGLLQQLQGVLGGAAGAGVIRLVSAGGDWYTLDGTVFTFQNLTQGWSYDTASGALTTGLLASNGWNWDSNTLPPPPDQNDPGRLWVVLYAPLNAPWCVAPAPLVSTVIFEGATWNAPAVYAGSEIAPTMMIAGLATPKMWMELVRNVIADFKPAGILCSHIIVTFDPSSFNPSSDSTPTSIPDGTWGYASSYIAADQGRVATRFPNAEYLQAHPDD